MQEHFCLSANYNILMFKSILTRPGGSDDLLYHQGHAVPQVITCLGEAPPVPLRAFRLRAVIPMDDLLQAKEQQKGRKR